MAKINILYLHNKSEISGGEQSLLALWENLDRDIFAPILIVPSQGEFSLQAAHKGIEVIYKSFPSVSPINIFSIVHSLFFLRKIIVKKHIHLIHSYTARNNVLAGLVGRFMHIPVIWHERNILMKEEKDITKGFLGLPTAVICNSRAVARRLDPHPSKIRIILNGVDLNKFSPMLVDDYLKKKYNMGDKKVIGIITNLTKRRRVEYFIEAAVAIHMQEPNTVFVVVGGEFGDEGRLKELAGKAQQLGLGDSLFFMGRQEDVRPWISIFDVSCHVTSQDACSRSILEAMGMKRAIVAMNDGGNPELIEHQHSGILVGAFDQNAFVNAILALLRDNSRREELGNNARLRVCQLFDIKVHARITQELYQECLRD